MNNMHYVRVIRPCATQKRLSDPPRVAVYPDGCLVKALTVSPPPVGVHGKRGVIKGWSVHSRMRLRRFLLTRGVPGWLRWGLTFTIPGKAVPAVAKRLFHEWARNQCTARGWAAVWRAEVQRRGEIHWHLIAFTPPAQQVTDSTAVPVGVRQRDDIQVARDDIRAALVGSWHRAIDTVGEYRSGKRVYRSRMDLRGAREHSAEAVPAPDHAVGIWLRYLADHASKRKQGQIGENIGRHWGVVGRRHFKPITALEAVEMSPEEYARVLRVLGKISRRRVRPHWGDYVNCHSRRWALAFGYKLGFRSKRGRRGSAVYFGDQATYRRIVKWAIEQSFQGSGVVGVGGARSSGSDVGDASARGGGASVSP